MPSNRTAKPASKPIDRNVEYGEREDGSLSGNLTRDPELRFTPAGRPVASTGVAVSERIKNDKTGDWEDTEPEFWNINIWGTQAENVAEYLRKGDRIVATGYYQDRTFTSKDGERQTVTEFTAKDIGPSMLWAGAKIIRAERSVK